MNSLPYGKLGYRTDKWFKKWLLRYQEARNKMDDNNRYIEVLSFVADKIESKDFVPKDEYKNGNLKDLITAVISMDGVNEDDLSSILFVNEKNKKYLLERTYRQFNENVVTYELFDEYDVDKNCLLLFKDAEKILEMLKDCIIEKSDEFDKYHSEAHKIGENIMLELANKKEVLSV